MTLVRSAVDAGVATVTLDSPDNRNALSSGLIAELVTALEAAIADDAVRVIVLSHTGPVFSSGADLKESAAAFAGGTPPVGRMGDVLATIWESPKPVVARVGGAARAGGLGLIAAADIAVATTGATFAFTEVRIGVIPAVISATVLPRLDNRAAAELYLTGDPFDGVRAAAIGLVTVAVPAEELDQTVARFTASLIRGAPGALAATKQLLRGVRADVRPVREQLVDLSARSVEFFRSAEGREGMTAFAEKRSPSWVPQPG